MSVPAVPDVQPSTEAGTAVARVPGQAVAPSVHGLTATGLMAVGAIAVGALALGSLAIGRLAIGQLALRSGRARRLGIQELTVVRVRVLDVVRTLPPR